MCMYMQRRRHGSLEILHKTVTHDSVLPTRRWWLFTTSLVQSQRAAVSNINFHCFSCQVVKAKGTRRCGSRYIQQAYQYFCVSRQCQKFILSRIFSYQLAKTRRPLDYINGYCVIFHSCRYVSVYSSIQALSQRGEEMLQNAFLLVLEATILPFSCGCSLQGRHRGSPVSIYLFFSAPSSLTLQYQISKIHLSNKQILMSDTKAMTLTYMPQY